MKDLGLTYDDVKAAANFLRKYARGVETRLYMDMKVDDAHYEISEAYRLADELDDLAGRMDTVTPQDLG
jgi:hypothetical protein